MKSRKIDMTGRKVGRLTVQECRGNNKFNQAVWLCQCECGNKIVATGSALRSGKTKSCGCLQREKARSQINSFNNSPHHITTGNLKHGENKTPLHSVWCRMRRRCRDKDNTYYGGRGIKVCKEWDESYLSFRNWALQNGYEEGLEIDRIDVNGDYKPDNCRWVTRKEQVRNRRNTVFLTVGSETKPLSQWCEEKGFDYKLAIGRYEKGFSVEEIFSPPGSAIHPPLRTDKKKRAYKKHRTDITPESVCELMKQGFNPWQITKMFNTDFETVRGRIMECDPDDLPEKWRSKALQEKKDFALVYAETMMER